MYVTSNNTTLTTEPPVNTRAEIRKLSIIIPAYNEENTITLILDKIRNVRLIHNIEKEVIIVNDCSTDATENVINNYIFNNPDITVKYFKLPVNSGKGAAIHAGILLSTGEFLLIQDADL